MPKKTTKEPKKTSFYTNAGSASGDLLRDAAARMQGIKTIGPGWANTVIVEALTDYTRQHPQTNKVPHFDFIVPGMTRAQADALLAVIVATVEAFGLDLGGGFVMEESEADNETET